MISERRKHSVFWFDEWLETYDVSSGRVIVHLPGGNTRLEKLRPLILEMVDRCDLKGVAIEFHVTDNGLYDGPYHIENHSNSNVSVYSIEGFFDIVPRLDSHGRFRFRSRIFSHRVVVRRMDVLEVDTIAELSKIDIIILDTLIHRTFRTGGRWDQGEMEAIQQELNDGGLLIRSDYTRDFKPIFSMISTPRIPMNNPLWDDVWYDVWKRK